jgi:hypothetical protein
MTERRSRREVAYGLGAYAAYLAVRRRVYREHGELRAIRNAQRIAQVEDRWHLGVEQRVQRAAMRVPRIVDVCNAGYAAGNVTLSVGWLIALHRRGDAGYRRERNAALAAFLLSLPVFLRFPTAPPRALDGYVDTLAERGLPLDHPLLVRFYNPIAAMPSQHIAFAVVSGLGLAARARSPLRRAGWRSYPAAIAVVVLATGNHFVADVVAGAGVGAIARAATR